MWNILIKTTKKLIIAIPVAMLLGLCFGLLFAPQFLSNILLCL